MSITDQELLEKNAHIPTEEIERDIRDTETEIATMRQEAEHLAQAPLSSPTARMDHLRAEARREGIRRRELFIDNLKKLLALRGTALIRELEMRSMSSWTADEMARYNALTGQCDAPCKQFVREGETTNCATCGFGKFEHDS